ncbi:MAG: helix-turn-helix domain-containing protein [Myxococcaceae bacterium]|nr:helix-turn-helix domain-containing protein [Myxococcaceae bacterium]
MAAERARQDFGRYLAAQRELRGLSRLDVVRATRLPSSLVGAIEEGETEKWPERVFVVNAVRSYAGVVGLPVAETLARFDGLPDAPKSEAFDPLALERARRERAISVVALGSALLLAGAVSGWLSLVWRFVERVSWSVR